MNLFPINRNSIALSVVAFVSIGFFVAGLFDVLDYFIMKALLFTGYAVLLVIALIHAFKNEDKKNRPEEILQDDSH